MQQHSCPCRNGNTPACAAGACAGTIQSLLGVALSFFAVAVPVVGLIALAINIYSEIAGATP